MTDETKTEPTLEERYTPEELEQQAKDREAIHASLDKTVGDILDKAKAAKDVQGAVAAVLDGIANEARVYREDGPTLEAFIDRVDAAKAEIAAAVAAH